MAELEIAEAPLMNADEVAYALNVKREWVYVNIPSVPMPGRLKRFDPDVVARIKNGTYFCSLKTEKKLKGNQKRTDGSPPAKEPLWD